MQEAAMNLFRRPLLPLLVLALWLPFTASAATDKPVEIHLFMGMSIPGGGAVTQAQWQSFLSDDLAKVFEGFTVVDATGYYQGRPERSKMVVLLLNPTDLPKAEAVAQRYARRFHQDSVMMVQSSVQQWRFITAAPTLKEITE